MKKKKRSEIFAAISFIVCLVLLTGEPSEDADISVYIAYYGFIAIAIVITGLIINRLYKNDNIKTKASGN